MKEKGEIKENKSDYDYDVYVICPVRNATDEEQEFLEQYKQTLESRGLKVCYPAISTNQDDDSGGYQICHDHCHEIARSREIYVYWNGKSTGSYVDLGCALMEHFTKGKKVILVKESRDCVEEIVEKQREKGITKSYEHVLLKLDDLANS
jgi:hypothetical protein